MFLILFKIIISQILHTYVFLYKIENVKLPEILIILLRFYLSQFHTPKISFHFAY